MRAPPSFLAGSIPLAQLSAPHHFDAMRLLTSLCLLSATLPMAAQQPANLGPQVAGLTQDMELLRDQVGKLTQQVTRLAAENQELRAQIGAQKNQAGAAATGLVTLTELNRTLDNLRLELRTASGSQRAEIMESVNKQIGDLVTRINAAFKELSNGKSTAVGNTPAPTASGSAPAAPATPPAPPAGKPETVPPTFSDDFPKTGVAYVVQSGDNLTTIAKKHNSSIRWIQNANKISDPVKEVKVGRKLFIPQKPEPAAPATPPAAN